MNQDMSVPLAYFITFTCYGAWIHGGQITSVDRYHNIPGKEFLPPNPKKANLIKTHMTEEPYLLDDLKRNIVLNAIKKVCVYRKWTLLAAHVRTNHVHIVCHAIFEPETIMNTLKAYASRELNRENLDKGRHNRWTRHGSTRYLWKEEEIEATLQYVVHEQGTPMALFENKERILLTAI